jgi:rRNA-processing protein FCF1
LGFLNGFEIVIPNFVEYTVDVLCENRLKSSFYSELDELRKLENDKIISILYCDYEKPLPEGRKELIDLEDEYILEIAVITNSILFTSDKGLRDEADSVKQPVIYIPPKYQRHFKELANGL